MGVGLFLFFSMVTCMRFSVRSLYPRLVRLWNMYLQVWLKLMRVEESRF